MRLLSGLHAHIVIFMAISKIGDRVLLLPERAGGHMSTASILERLGLEIIEVPVSAGGFQIDRERTMDIVRNENLDFIFIDRSEGLCYEDFSGLFESSSAYKVFDASQYLTNIISGHHKHPFDMGFDMVVSTIHKNFPGPQRAIAFTKRRDEFWKKVLAGISTYVSNMHVDSIYAAGMCLNQPYLQEYSARMLDNAVGLEAALAEQNLPIIRRHGDAAPTHHLWLLPPSREEAFRIFADLERARILTNFRLLPYGLGYGIRMGTSGATRLGLGPQHVNRLAELVARIARSGPVPGLRHAVRQLAEEIRHANVQYGLSPDGASSFHSPDEAPYS
ncbi:MAG: hypothetical protein HQL42_18000 [Alphaproteobacteria bacterium]|nr:hypothetical protein [Alphaproteobacteria bacterium]